MGETQKEEDTSCAMLRRSSSAGAAASKSHQKFPFRRADTRPCDDEAMTSVSASAAGATSARLHQRPPVLSTALP